MIYDPLDPETCKLYTDENKQYFLIDDTPKTKTDWPNSPIPHFLFIVVRKTKSWNIHTIPCLWLQFHKVKEYNWKIKKHFRNRKCFFMIYIIILFVNQQPSIRETIRILRFHAFTQLGSRRSVIETADYNTIHTFCILS